MTSECQYLTTLFMFTVMLLSLKHMWTNVIQPLYSRRKISWLSASVQKSSEKPFFLSPHNVDQFNWSCYMLALLCASISDTKMQLKSLLWNVAWHLATDLPLGVTSSSPSLEERRLLTVHKSVGQVISCSGKVMRSLVEIYGDVSEVLYPVLVFD